MKVSMYVAAVAMLMAPASARAVTYAITYIDVPNSYGTTVVGINNLGQVAGYYSPDSPYLPFSSFVWTAGVFSYFNAPDSFFKVPSSVTLMGAPLNSTQVRGINDNGDLVGQYYNCCSVNPFLYSNGVYQTLTAPAATQIVPSDINDLGQITGSIGNLGFIETAGQITTFAGPNGNSKYLTISPIAINDSGTVSGNFSDYTGSGGFLYNPTTGFQVVTYPDPRTSSTQIGGINDLGQVLGTAILGQYPAPTTYINFLYDGTTFTPTSEGGGTNAINDFGVIAGTAYDPVNMHNIGFIATPIAATLPESAGIWSTAVALLAVFGIRTRSVIVRRRRA